MIMNMTRPFNDSYRGKKVLITGHAGFKGSWLCLWLQALGAEVIGYSLSAPSQPNHLDLLNLDIISITGDIRDQAKLAETFATHQPDIVFHLAAQPLVRLSYKEPYETFETNVMGTLRVLEACRRTASVKAIINITSDKCYDNREWIWGYRENDPMGGYDPYSASKGCAELVTTSFRNSFFNLDEYGRSHHVLLASCRAGNVIGGGDWADDRLIPDIMRAVAGNQKVAIRNPYATRPWQHVLEPLSGYLLLGQRLLQGEKEFAEGWNFGPGDEGSVTVEEVVKHIKKSWDRINYEISIPEHPLHEAGLLKLDCSKAHIKLQWNNVWDAEQTFAKTVTWYQNFYDNGRLVSGEDLADYINDATRKNISWAVEKRTTQ